MVTIRLARHGAKGSPYYHLAVADRAAKRDGRFIERVGFFNPVARGKAERLRIDLERVDYWLSVGAIPSERVSKLLVEARKLASEGAPEVDTKAPKAEQTQAAATAAAATAAAETTEAAPAGDAAGEDASGEDASEGEADQPDEAAGQGPEKTD
jgi:small subunit ribosomal protein S16